jgi:5-formyltetrahydrofolate cyclo-ligase
MEKSSGSSKAELRATALERREALFPALREQFGYDILNRILATEQYREAKTVMAYCSFGSEIDTSPFLHATLDHGKTLLLPKINRSAGLLDIYQVRNLDSDLLTGVWNIREPNPTICAPAIPSDLDLILVPGVAFDREGGRIGHGKGYYDKLLAQCPNTYKIAAAFEAQIFDRVPMYPHDIPIDALITESDSTHIEPRL